MSDPTTPPAPPPAPPSGPPPSDESGRIASPEGQEGIAWRKWCIGVGGLMMLLSLLLSVLFPVQPGALYLNNRAFMALGGGLMAGGLLGFLNIEIKALKQSITAGGGVGVFVLLFLVNPPAMTASAAAPAARRATLNAIADAALPSSPDGASAAVSRPTLDRLVREQGFSSFAQFRVTAGGDDIETLERRVRSLDPGR
jgi:hypothetical protein